MRRGFTTLEIVAAVAVVGFVAWLGLPKLFHGSSRRANKSTEATQQLVVATTAQGSAVAASVTKIAEANSEAPASPSKDFIGQEATLALSQLPAPDPKALLEAERRKVAVMQGRLEEARDLYSSAALRADRLQREVEEALEARRQADLALEKAAAAERARTLQALGASAALVVTLLVGGWLYLNGRRLRTWASRIVPRLDEFYDRADGTLQAKLDTEVFEPLRGEMDRTEKLLTKELRVAAAIARAKAKAAAEKAAPSS